MFTSLFSESLIYEGCGRLKLDLTGKMQGKYFDISFFAYRKLQFAIDMHTDGLSLISTIQCIVVGHTSGPPQEVFPV